MSDFAGRFVWYELMTPDMDAATSFYGSVLGWQALDHSIAGAPYRLFAAGDTPVAGLMAAPAGETVTAHWMGYISSDDVDVTTARITELGGSVLVAPTEVPEISRFAVVADPQRASFALVKGLKPNRFQALDRTLIGGVGWHELLAANFQEALAFYGALFHWQKVDIHTGAMGIYQQFAIDGEAAGGMFNKPPTLPFPFWLYYFNVADIAAAATRVEAAGGTIVYGPTEVPGGAWILHLLDPQGAIVALIDRRARKPVGYYVSSRPAKTTPT